MLGTREDQPVLHPGQTLCLGKQRNLPYLSIGEGGEQGGRIEAGGLGRTEA